MLWNSVWNFLLAGMRWDEPSWKLKWIAYSEPRQENQKKFIPFLHELNFAFTTFSWNIFLIQVPNLQLKNGVKFPPQSFSFVVLLEKARVNHFLWHLKFFKKWSRSTLFLFLNFDLTRKYSYPLLLMWWSFQRC